MAKKRPRFKFERHAEVVIPNRHYQGYMVVENQRFSWNLKLPVPLGQLDKLVPKPKSVSDVRSQLEFRVAYNSDYVLPDLTDREFQFIVTPFIQLIWKMYIEDLDKMCEEGEVEINDEGLQLYKSILARVSN